MRYVNYPKKFVFKFPGLHVFEDALVFGDVDNDGENELVVGTEEGFLSVYKRQYTWQTMNDHDSRAIRGIGVGNILGGKEKVNYLVAISEVAYIVTYLCLVQPGEEEILRPIHRQNLLWDEDLKKPNGHGPVKKFLLTPVLQTVQNDIVVAYADGSVRIYSWEQTPVSFKYVCHRLCVPHIEVGNLCSMATLFADANRTEYLGKSPVMTQSGPGFMVMNLTDMLVENFSMTGLNLPGKYMPEDRDGSRCRVLCDFGPDNSFVLSHNEGFVYVINRENRLMWVQKFDHNVFSLRKANLKGDDTNHLLAACWSGHTYIMDIHGDMCCFNPRHYIQAFDVGRYGRVGMALAYATMDQRVVIYYGADMKKMVVRSFINVLQASSPTFKHYSHKQLAELARYCMYHVYPTDEDELTIPPIPHAFEPEPPCCYRQQAPRPKFLGPEVKSPSEPPSMAVEESPCEPMADLDGIEVDTPVEEEKEEDVAERRSSDHSGGSVMVGDVVIGSVTIETDRPRRRSVVNLEDVAEENVEEENVEEEIVEEQNVEEEIASLEVVSEEDVPEEEDASKNDVPDSNDDIENGSSGTGDEDEDSADTSENGSQASPFSGSPNE